MKHTFPKEERLCSRRMIALLFAEGHSFYVRPFRVTWIRPDVPVTVPAQVMMSVPKYNFRKAVQRNLIRRRMKEAYRLHKHVLFDHLIRSDRRIVFCIAFTAKEIMPYDLIRAKIIVILQRLMEANEEVTG
jgi:ribonuclease P protein component